MLFKNQISANKNYQKISLKFWFFTVNCIINHTATPHNTTAN